MPSRYDVFQQYWPEVKGEIESDTITIVIQINGKKISTMQVDSTLSKDQEKIQLTAMKDEETKMLLSGKQTSKTIYVPGKLINFVTN